MCKPKLLLAEHMLQVKGYDYFVVEPGDNTLGRVVSKHRKKDAATKAASKSDEYVAWKVSGRSDDTQDPFKLEFEQLED